MNPESLTDFRGFVMPEKWLTCKVSLKNKEIWVMHL